MIILVSRQVFLRKMAAVKFIKHYLFISFQLNRWTYRWRIRIDLKKVTV